MVARSRRRGFRRAGVVAGAGVVLPAGAAWFPRPARAPARRWCGRRGVPLISDPPPRWPMMASIIAPIMNSTANRW